MMIKINSVSLLEKLLIYTRVNIILMRKPSYVLNVEKKEISMETTLVVILKIVLVGS